MTEEETRKLAEEHWNWLVPRYKQMFIDGWLHGAKHEWETKQEELK